MAVNAGAGLNRAILETAHEAFISMDAEGNIIDCNREAERTFGWERAAILGRELAALLVPERHRERHRAGLARFLAGGEPQLMGRRLEMTALHCDGRELPIEMTISYIRDGQGITFHAFLHDISERMLADQVLRSLQSVTQAMTRAGTPDRAFTAMLSKLGTDMGWAVGSYWECDSDGSLQLVAAWTAPGVEAARFETAGRQLRLGPGEGLPGSALAGGEPVWLTELWSTPSHRIEAAREVGLRTAIVVPVTRAGKGVGVIEFFATEQRDPDPTVTSALKTVGEHIGELVGILEHRHALLKNLEALALTDGLTGLPNRRAWEEALQRELARAARETHPVCVSVVDLDDFKGYNDSFGHQAGDALLSEAAHAWRAQLRAGDLLARYGGEEFVVVIPGRGLEPALRIVERLRGATPGGRTCSAGLACWDGEESPERLFARADAAMYAAKQAGRNRTVVAR